MIGPNKGKQVSSPQDLLEHLLMFMDIKSLQDELAISSQFCEAVD